MKTLKELLIEILDLEKSLSVESYGFGDIARQALDSINSMEMESRSIRKQIAISQSFIVRTDWVEPKHPKRLLVVDDGPYAGEKMAEFEFAGDAKLAALAWNYAIKWMSK